MFSLIYCQGQGCRLTRQWYLLHGVFSVLRLQKKGHMLTLIPITQRSDLYWLDIWLYDFIAIDFYTFRSISNMQSLFLSGPLFSSVLSRFSHTKVSLENFLVGVSLMIPKKETRKFDFMRWRQKIITKEESKCAFMAFSTKPMKWVVGMQEYLDTLVDEEYRRAILYRVGFCYPYQLLLGIRGAFWCLHKS